MQQVTSALERTRQLPRLLLGHAGFGEAVAALERGGQATFHGAWGSSCALLAAALDQCAPGPLVVVCPHAADVDILCDDLAIFTARAAWRFPAWDTESAERTVHDDVHCERLRTLKMLARLAAASRGQGDPGREVRGAQPTPSGTPDASPLVVTSIQSLLQPAPSRQQIENSSRWLCTGRRIDVEELLRWLVEQRFQATSAVELPGEFSARGGILDLFAPDWQQPVRVELFDEEVESIRRFDVVTQRSQEALDAIEITILAPVGEYQAQLSVFLPSHAWYLLLEPEEIEVEAQHYASRLERPQDVHGIRSVMQEISRFAVASAAAISSGELGVSCQLAIESVERFSGEVGRVRDELGRAADVQDVFVVSTTDAEAARLSDMLGDSRPDAGQCLHFPVGHLRQGFRLVRERMMLISANELFQRGEVRRVPRRRMGRPLENLFDLREGDRVVHLSHGIGRYRGVELLDKQGQVEEHLIIEFYGGAKIYVPASKIDLVQKYLGGTKSRPTLAKLGGSTWLRQMEAAESAVLDMAAEMLDLQAQRVSRPGIAFAPDGEWQYAFDASFPYTETPDQLDAIRAIKSDMERPRPMDRLLCGDVGFGKTEVAMRAAFKAVNSGYQVAVLVPTTILAEQHYRTFAERMAEFPFDVARLSRFCSGREEREILQGLSSGRIDIVIGTHRLASRDVQFHNLGLVVIDEEQRFGVEVKERLKTFRATVDVLTMTATPIPRTLHMGLVGVRDISNLESPPEDRLNVESRVTRFNHELIRHAVLRELNRSGQVFFVHNRIQDIDALARVLHQCAPEARLEIAHGRMPEDELERVMVDFVAGRFDLLLATTIVENGLDIPNANTIFIDEADRYGLADLHQLRGRVGRYKHRAYCYLLVDPHKHITPNAAKRLRAIEEFSDIGAGFAISMRDLEIRGAGNLLGVQQSGHIAAVGYEHYCQLLEAAVRRLKQLPPKFSVDVEIDLPGSAYLPDEYVSDIRLKIDLYRRLRSAATYDELAEFRRELQDRFGPLPPAARRITELAELKLDAAIWQIKSIHVEGENVVFRYTGRPRAEQLARRQPGLRLVDETSLYLKAPQEVGDPAAILAAVKSVLRPD